MAASRSLMIAALLGCLALPAFAAESGDNKLQADDSVIESCLAEVRQQNPDATAHDRRIILSTQCICAHATNLCRQGMIQDGRLRQRVTEDKSRNPVSP